MTRLREKRVDKSRPLFAPQEGSTRAMARLSKQADITPLAKAAQKEQLSPGADDALIPARVYHELSGVEIAGPVSRTIRIDGRLLAINVVGKAALTVVLESGLDAKSEDWRTIEAQISPYARVFRYDRAGCGRSAPPNGPRNALDLVDDLRIALRAACISGPYILVGHCFGGLLMRVFAHICPSEVLGLVLVDSTHPAQFDRLGALIPVQVPGEPPKLTHMRAFWTQGWRDPQATGELIDFPRSFGQDRAVTTLGDLPLHVLVAGTFSSERAQFGVRSAVMQSLWQSMQMDFLRLSSDVMVSYVPESGHFVQRESPESVSDAVIKMIRKVSRDSKMRLQDMSASCPQLLGRETLSRQAAPHAWASPSEQPSNLIFSPGTPKAAEDSCQGRSSGCPGK